MFLCFFSPTRPSGPSWSESRHVENQNWELDMFRQYGQGEPLTTVPLDVILNYVKTKDTSVSNSEMNTNQENKNLKNENEFLMKELEKNQELLENKAIKCKKLEAEISRTTRMMELVSKTVFSATGMAGLQHPQGGLGGAGQATTGMTRLQEGLGGAGQAATGRAGLQHLQHD